MLIKTARALVLMATILLLVAVAAPLPPSLFLHSLLIIGILYGYTMAFIMTLSYWESARAEVSGSVV
jgi:hypothetical protein